MIEKQPGQDSSDSMEALVFQIEENYYAVDARLVRQVLWLPELAPIEDQPEPVIGLFVLRQQRVLVVDLLMRLGYPLQPRVVTDCVIVVELDEELIGIPANYVHDVVTLELIASHHQEESIELSHHLLPVQAQYQDQILMVLNLAELLPADAVGWHHREHQPHCCESFNEHDRALLKQRATSYRSIDTDMDELNVMGVVVLRLGDEFFGIPLSTIKEFSNTGEFNPIPCCPPWVVGNMNLRGDIVTLIEVSEQLGVTLPDRSQLKKLVVYLHHQQLLGIMVEEIVDILFLSPTMLKPLPVALGDEAADYIQGEVPFQSSMVTLINLEQLFSRDLLIVDEVV